MLISVSKNDLEFLMDALVTEITMLREDDPFVIESRRVMERIEEKITQAEERRKIRKEERLQEKRRPFPTTSRKPITLDGLKRKNNDRN